MKSKPITSVVIVFLFVFSIWACEASIIRTIPNVSIIDPSYVTSETSVNTIKVKELLSDLTKDNPALAFELGKLPELQDAITSAEIGSLERFIEFYNKNPNRFNDVFVRMNRVGITEVRKYSVPLQAIFWLVKRRRMEEIENFLDLYSQQLIEHYMDLNVLLVYAWNFSDESEWGNFEEILDRLNSPELFEYWFARNFNYDLEKLFKVAYAPYGYPQSLRQTIMTKKGICHDAAYAACSCLERGGYDVTPLFVVYANRTALGAGGHFVCLIKARDSIGNREYLVVGDTNRKGQIGGPFKSIAAAAEYAAKGIGIRDYFVGRFGW